MIQRQSLAPLRHTRFRYFISARLCSLLGHAIAPIALAFAVLDLTGSASALGLILAARTIPMVLFVLIGGVIADRFRRDHVLIVSHTVGFLTQATAATLLLTGLANLWQLAVIEVLNGMATAFTFPALQGMLPQIVARRELQRANALNGLVRNATLIGGGALAGAIVAFVGPGWGLAADAAAYGLATLLISRIRLPEMSSDGAADGRESSSAWRDLRDGWTEFVARRWVWVIVLAFGLINAAIGCGLHTLGPVVADETFGRVGWGLLQSGFGIGLVIGALIMLRWRPRLPLVAGMLGTLLTAGQLLMLGQQPAVVPLLVVYFFAGVGLDVFGVGWETALQHYVPGDRLSRVASYDALGSFIAIPIGQLAAGPLASTFGTSAVITGCGLLVATVVGLTIADRSVRGLHRVEPAATTSS